MKLSFFVILVLTLILNLMFQKNIADAIDSDWITTTVEDGGTIPIEFPDADQLALPKGLTLEIPPVAVLVLGNKGPYKEVRAVLQPPAEKIDVLFVGDSTIEWGFDYHQFEINSGLVARSLAFGLNVPDEHLAQVVTGIAHCFMNKDGVVILSFADHVLGRERAGRPQDKAIQMAANLKNDCSKVSKFWRPKEPEPEYKKRETPDALELLLSRDKYNQNFFDKIVDFSDTASPFWSAKINLYDFIVSELSTAGKKNITTDSELRFLRWTPTFKVPLGEDFNTWRNEAVAMSDIGVSEDVENVDIRRNNFSLWSDQKIGVHVCSAIPIANDNSIHRYAEWLHWERSSCLLVYSNILRRVGVEQDLDIQGPHHLANQSGLIMAAALGKYFKEYQVLDTYIASGNQPDDATLYLRQ